MVATGKLIEEQWLVQNRESMEECNGNMPVILASSYQNDPARQAEEGNLLPSKKHWKQRDSGYSRNMAPI